MKFLIQNIVKKTSLDQKISHLLLALIFTISFPHLSFANCITLDEDKIEFLSDGVNSCDRGSDTTVITLYNNNDINNAKEKNDLNAIISGRSDGGYSIHFTFDRDNSTLSGEQLFFAAYDDMNAGNVVAKAGLKSGEFFYEAGNTVINGINMSALNDPEIDDPHIAIIVYNERKKTMTLNIDGAEVVTSNVEPIIADKIARIEFGNNYIGEMSVVSAYATRMSIQDRIKLAGILSVATPTKIYEAVKENGITKSGLNRGIKKCQTGKILNTQTDNCTNVTLTFGQDGNDSLPSYVNHPTTITYNSSTTSSNKSDFSCATGYEIGSTSPKYWFSASGENAIIHTEGECTLPAECYSATPGTVPDESVGGCGGMLIVDRVMLDTAIANDSYSITANGTAYTFGDSTKNGDGAKNIFTGQVTNMSELFKNKATFNEDIGYWNVANVTNIYSMFDNALAFNQDISNWDVGEVTNMSTAFKKAEAFNQDIGSWDVSKVTNMQYMFWSASVFNQDIGSWDVSKVTDTSYMFRGAAAFNQDIGNWDVSKVYTMYWMFYGAITFDRDIGSWNVGNVTNMQHMFRYASSFNQDISGWDVSKVNNMGTMFEDASAFDQDISGWDVVSVTNCSNFATRAGALTSPTFTSCSP